MYGMRDNLRRAFEMVDTARKPGPKTKTKGLATKQAQALQDAMEAAKLNAAQAHAISRFGEGRISRLLKGIGWPKKEKPSLKFRILARTVRADVTALLNGEYVEDKSVPIESLVTPEVKAQRLLASEVGGEFQIIIDSLFEQHCLAKNG